jgi:hypothetical protein
MPREQTAFDSRSFSDEEKFREAELGAGASCNPSGPDPSTAAVGKFTEEYETGQAGFVTNTKV